MLDPQFYNKDGSITAYSFLCGYCMRKETATQWAEIYMEHRTYHVRRGPIEDGQHKKFEVWENFDRNELTKARTLYRNIFKPATA